MSLVSKRKRHRHGIFVFLQRFPRHVRFAFVVVATWIFYSIPEEFIYDPLPLCFFRFLFDWECPGCGTTRGFWCILHFRFEDAYHYNSWIWLTFPLFVSCLLHWVFSPKIRSLKNRVFPD
ncbi:DUF2752 domain-containing protein [Leptospira stimsonii]|uniref:DUF2752 domain-containing protein n=1 Tax=Leptospira stimsonii TaxID=2202203 RepID=A0A396YMG0_9LEPT|nr:DUF2752 domain-containing protein [Leptospira stimsonii]RHX84271.1 DUF2752 domain-containing protein [Leptospira stimsonii]